MTVYPPLQSSDAPYRGKVLRAAISEFKSHIILIIIIIHLTIDLSRAMPMLDPQSLPPPQHRLPKQPTHRHVMSAAEGPRLYRMYVWYEVDFTRKFGCEISTSGNFYYLIAKLDDYCGNWTQSYKARFLYRLNRQMHSNRSLPAQAHNEGEVRLLILSSLQVRVTVNSYIYWIRLTLA